jgi:hypothetical protein
MLDRHLAEIVGTDAALAHRYQLLLACTLIALLPELGRMSRKQVAALVGVAPYAFESGKFKGRRCIWGGRAPVRNVLYMGAMSASNWNSCVGGSNPPPLPTISMGYPRSRAVSPRRVSTKSARGGKPAVAQLGRPEP